jgi:hypothetical protein
MDATQINQTSATTASVPTMPNSSGLRLRPVRP